MLIHSSGYSTSRSVSSAGAHNNEHLQTLFHHRKEELGRLYPTREFGDLVRRTSWSQIMFPYKLLKVSPQVSAGRYFQTRTSQQLAVSLALEL